MAFLFKTDRGVTLTPDWHFFSRPLVASLGFSGGPVSPDSPFRHPFGISFQDLSWRRLSFWAVARRSFRHPIGISLIFFECHLGWLDYPWHSFAFIFNKIDYD